MKNLFDREAPLGPKLIAVSVLGIGAGIYSFIGDSSEISLVFRLVVALVSAGVVVAICLGLILRDRTASRMANGQEVSKIERLLFTPSCIAVSIWLIVGLVALAVLMLPLVFLPEG